MRSVHIKKNKAIFSETVQQKIILDNTRYHTLSILDESGKIRSWNGGGVELMGYEPKDIVGLDFSTLFSRIELNKRLPEKLLQLCLKKGSAQGEGILRRKDGTFFVGSCVLNSVNKNIGKKSSCVLVIEDITKRRELERQKEEYIGLVSHEIKTPISTISLYSELLSERLNLLNDKKTKKMLEVVQSQTSRLLGLVEDLLVVNQIERNKLVIDKKSVDLNALIRRVKENLELIHTTHKIVFHGRAKKKVLADEARIEQVIVNLLSNGIKYSPSARKIVVRVREIGKKVQVEVQDFGPGISKRDQKNIFKRFYRSDNLQSLHTSGLGLGLFISKEIILKHNEKIWVSSRTGQGCRFFFTLPMFDKS